MELLQAGVDRSVHGQRAGPCAVPETGKDFERLLRTGGQSAEPALHEGHNVVSEIFCVDAVRVPSPRLLSRIKNDQPFVREPSEKLNREKRVSPGLLMKQFDQRVSTLGIDSKRIADKLRKVIKRKRRERHVSYLNALSFDSGQRLRQRME